MATRYLRMAVPAGGDFGQRNNQPSDLLGGVESLVIELNQHLAERLLVGGYGGKELVRWVLKDLFQSLWIGLGKGIDQITENSAQGCRKH